MIKHKIIAMIAAAVIMMTGCGKSDITSSSNPDTPQGYEPSTTPISFQTEYNWGYKSSLGNIATRGTITNEFKGGDNIAVFAYYLPNGGVFDESSSQPNFMYNQCVTMQSVGNWTYSPAKYWSNNQNDNYKFFAYSPHSGNSAEDNNGIIISGSNVAGYPSVKYLPTEDATKNASFMVAEPVFIEGKGAIQNNIQFKFKHQMAQLKFKFKHNGTKFTQDGNATGDGVKIESIEIAGVRESRGKFCEKRTEDELSFVWDNIANDATTTTVITSVENGGLKDDVFIRYSQEMLEDRAYEDVTTDIGGMLLAPQKGFFNSNNTLEIVVNFLLKKSSNGALITPMQAVQRVVFNPLDLEPAHTYTLCFTLDVLGLEGVVLGGEVIREQWKSAGPEYDFGDIE